MSGLLFLLGLATGSFLNHGEALKLLVEPDLPKADIGKMSAEDRGL